MPYVFKPFLRADDSTFHLSTESGHVRLSMRAGEWSGFDVKLSPYHLEALASGKVKQVVLNEKRAGFMIEKQAPEKYVPTSVIALDTNERSLDGITLSASKGSSIIIPFPEISVVQHRHFVRRRKMARKKQRDRRVGRKLLSLTINMNPSTQAAVLRDVVMSLLGHGVRKLVILNSHGGNDFKQTIRELQGEKPDMFICTINWWQILPQKEFFEAQAIMRGRWKRASCSPSSQISSSL